MCICTTNDQFSVFKFLLGPWVSVMKGLAIICLSLPWIDI